jgi:hypothetical protein
LDNKATLELAFLTSLGSKDTYSIPRANTSLDDEAVYDLMSDVISNGHFGSKHGQPVETFGAELVQTTYDKFAMGTDA